MCAYDGGVRVAAVAAIAVVALLASVQAQSRVRAAPEGRFALDSGTKIVVGELAGGAGHTVPTAGVSNDQGAVGSRPTGRSSCSVAAAGSFSAEPTAAARASSPGRPSTPGTPQWTPDGLSFAYGYDGFAGLCDRRASAVPGIVFALRDGTRVREFDVGPARPTPTLARAFSLFGWRPDGSRLLDPEIDQRQGYCEPEFSDHALRTSLLTVGRSGGRPALLDGRPRSHLHSGRRMERVSSTMSGTAGRLCGLAGRRRRQEPAQAVRAQVP